MSQQQQQPPSPPPEYQYVEPVIVGVGGCQNVGLNIVRQQTTGALYVEKRVHRDYIDAGDFHREVHAMEQCGQHRNIIGLIAHDANHWSLGYGRIVMQRCELGSLDQLILRCQVRNQRLSDEGFLWKVLWDLSLALCFLSTGADEMSARQAARLDQVVVERTGWNGIIHRDLRPSNLFLTAALHQGPDGDSVYPTCVLGDFGCSVSHADIRAGQSGFHLLPDRDLAFSPPETPFYCERGDVYGCGLIVQCLVLMEQEPPEDDSGLLTSLVEKDITFSKGLDTVLETCLNEDLDARPRPNELPALVWKHHSEWRACREDGGSPLPAWTLVRRLLIDTT